MRVRVEKTILSAVVRMGGDERGRVIDYPVEERGGHFSCFGQGGAAQNIAAQGWDHIIINFLILLS